MNKQDNRNSSEEKNPIEEKKSFEKKNLIKLLPAAAVIGALAVTGFSGNQENVEKETKAAVQSEELESLLMTAYSYTDTDSTTSTTSTDSSKDKKKTASSKKKKKSGLSTGTTKARPSESEKTSATGQGSTSTPTTTVPEGGYADGTYTGSGTGFGGTITVSVTVSGGKIASIDIVSAPGETPSYFASAKGVISSILSAQNPNVDAVSGATYSSNGIISAVQNALSQAGSSGSNSSKKNTSTKKKTTPTPTAKPINIKKPDKNSTYKDGTYSGEAEGFSGTVKVTVTIKNGKITRVSNTNTDTKEYFDQAWKSIQPAILKKQGVYGVDTVSGATYSSNGIIGAAQNALNKALTKKKTTPTPTPAAATATPTPTPEISAEPTQTPSEDTAKTYTARARGFQGWVNITITVKDGKIISVENMNQDTPAYFRSAWNSIQPKILENQSTEGIDTVSGATYSSEGILNAAQKAITAAKEDKAFDVTPTPTEAPEVTATPTPTPETTETPEPTETPEVSLTPTPTPETTETPAAGYLDGTYSGTAFGYEDYVTVTVTIADGKITEITNSNADDPDYFEDAWNGIYPKILENQSTDGVDTVSGATFSSQGILQAAASALSQAKG